MYYINIYIYIYVCVCHTIIRASGTRYLAKRAAGMRYLALFWCAAGAFVFLFSNYGAVVKSLVVMPCRLLHWHSTYSDAW